MIFPLVSLPLSLSANAVSLRPPLARGRRSQSPVVGVRARAARCTARRTPPRGPKLAPLTGGTLSAPADNKLSLLLDYLLVDVLAWRAIGPAASCQAAASLNLSRLALQRCPIGRRQWQIINERHQLNAIATDQLHANGHLSIGAARPAHTIMMLSSGRAGGCFFCPATFSLPPFRPPARARPSIKRRFRRPKTISKKRASGRVMRPGGRCSWADTGAQGRPNCAPEVGANSGRKWRSECSAGLRAH